MMVKYHDLYRAVRQPAGHLHRRPGVHYGVSDQLAGEQHSVIDQVVAPGQLPRPQRVTDEAARCRRGRWFRLVRRGRDEIIPCLHMPS